MMSDAWRSTRVNGVDLAYQMVGQGEPVLLIHAGVVADWFAPVLGVTALIERYRLLTYHRVNYGRSAHGVRPVSIAEQAAQARALLHRLGIGRAHVVGHSAGAAIALQLAMDAPALVQSLTVMDPALSTEPATLMARAPQSERPAGPPFIAQALNAYAAGDRAAAVDTFMAGVCGPDYRA